jgi:hypothetical protein
MEKNHLQLSCHLANKTFFKNKLHYSLFLNIDLMCTLPKRSGTNLTRFEDSFFLLDLKSWKDYQNAMDLIDLYELEMLY